MRYWNDAPSIMEVMTAASIAARSSATPNSLSMLSILPRHTRNDSTNAALIY